MLIHLMLNPFLALKSPQFLLIDHGTILDPSSIPKAIRLKSAQSCTTNRMVETL
jgi:hypothetical protein